MPDTRTGLQQKDAETTAAAAVPAAKSYCKPTVMQRLFPYLASLSVIGGIGYLTFYMDREVAAGRLTGMPYVLIALMFGALFVVHHFLYRKD